VFLQSDPPRTSRMGLLFPIEGDRWMVTAQGAGGDHPPTDDEGFNAFLRSLRGPEIHDDRRRPDRGAAAGTADAFFLLRPPQSLFHPRILVRAMRHRDNPSGGIEVAPPAGRGEQPSRPEAA